MSSEARAEKELENAGVAVAIAIFAVMAVVALCFTAGVAYVLHFAWKAGNESRRPLRIAAVLGLICCVLYGLNFLAEAHHLDFLFSPPSRAKPRPMSEFPDFLSNWRNFFIYSFVGGMILAPFGGFFTKKYHLNGGFYLMLRAIPSAVGDFIGNRAEKVNFFVFALSLVILVLVHRANAIENKVILLSMELLWGFLFFSWLPYCRGDVPERTRMENMLARPDLVPVGKDKFDWVYLSDEQLNYHVQVVGQSGTGKTVFLRTIYTHHILSERGFLMIDLKADTDILSELGWLCHERNSLDRLCILKLDDPKFSFSWNPLARGGATAIRDKIVAGLEKSDNVFYQAKAESALQKVLNGLVYVRDSGKRMPGLQDVLTNLSSASDVERLILELKDLRCEDPLILKPLAELMQELETSSGRESLQGIRTQLELFLYSEFGAIFKKTENSFDILKAIDEQRYIYISLDSQQYRASAQRLGKMFLAELRAVSGFIASNRQQSERKRFTVIVDEFSDLATPEFAAFMNKARGSGLGIIVAHQELSDLKTVSPEVHDQVINNTSTKVIFRQQNPQARDFIAKMAGTFTTTKYTHQYEDNLFFGKHKTGVSSAREVQEYRVKPDELRELPNLYAVMFAPETLTVFHVLLHQLRREPLPAEIKNQINQYNHGKKRISKPVMATTAAGLRAQPIQAPIPRYRPLDREKPLRPWEL